MKSESVQTELLLSNSYGMPSESVPFATSAIRAAVGNPPGRERSQVTRTQLQICEANVKQVEICHITCEGIRIILRAIKESCDLLLEEGLHCLLEKG